MSPQPLSYVKRNARIISNPSALRSRPELAVLIGHVISLWSHIEANLGVSLTRMLEGGVRSGTAMYQAVQSLRTQFAVLQAVARIEIPKEHLPTFDALLRLVGRAAKKRDKLVHWLWAISPDIEDALLLIDPDGAMDYHTALSEHLAKHPGHGDMIEAKDVPPLDPRIVLVYREKDFQEIIYELNGVWHLTETLIGCVTRTHISWPSPLWSLLTSAPQIAEEISRQTNRPHETD